MDAWDEHLEQRRIEAQEKAVAEMNERHAELALVGLRKILQRLQGDDVEGVKALDASLLSAQDIARLAETMSKIERLSRGSETERVSSAVQHKMPVIRLAFDPTPRIMDGVDASGYAENDILQMVPQRELPPAA